MRRRATTENSQQYPHQHLERQIKGLKMAVLLLAVVLASILTMAMKNGASEKILRVQGIIIEDAQGKARMLVGAPFPTVDEKKETTPLSDSSCWMKTEPTASVSVIPHSTPRSRIRL